MTWYSSGNHKVPDVEKDNEGKCPDCGSNRIFEVGYCGVWDDKCEGPCQDWKDGRENYKEICPEHKTGTECKNCGKVWRD